VNNAQYEQYAKNAIYVTSNLIRQICQKYAEYAKYVHALRRKSPPPLFPYGRYVKKYEPPLPYDKYGKKYAEYDTPPKKKMSNRTKLRKYIKYVISNPALPQR
jgi:hypothetical protein